MNHPEMIRTNAERDTEIAALEECLLFVPARTLFGEENHPGIRAAIRVITELMDEDKARDEYPPDTENDNNRLEDAAVEASRWLVDCDAEAPSKGWQGLRPIGWVAPPSELMEIAITAATFRRGKTEDPYEKLAKAVVKTKASRPRKVSMSTVLGAAFGMKPKAKRPAAKKTVVDPITGKRVKTKPIRVTAGNYPKTKKKR
jgi:hypothetical protein